MDKKVIQASEWMIKFNVFSRAANIEAHVIHLTRVIITYTLGAL